VIAREHHPLTENKIQRVELREREREAVRFDCQRENGIVLLVEYEISASVVFC
jgi:hypothetical protein